jgi:hypothetical protein
MRSENHIGEFVFREGGVYFLQRLRDEKIPLLVFSAGIGGEVTMITIITTNIVTTTITTGHQLIFLHMSILDIVQEVLVQQAADSTNKLDDNITIVSNYIKWDDEGNMEGIEADILHSSNKGAFAASLNYKDTVRVQRI